MTLADGQEPPDPECDAAVREAIGEARGALRDFTLAGVRGLFLRGAVRRQLRRRRLRRGKLLALATGSLVFLLSVTNCSRGTDLASMTAEYGRAVPASRSDARQLVEKVTRAVRRAATSHELRLSVSESEATAALSLGLMMPDLMRAMDTMPAEEIQSTESLADLRERIRSHQQDARPQRGFWGKVWDRVDPHLRTGDVQVLFTGDHQVVVAGYVQAWHWQQPALVVVAPTAGEGELELDFVKGRLGWLPAPAWAFDLLGRLTSSLVLLGDDYARITNLTVEEGRMTFVGTMNR